MKNDSLAGIFRAISHFGWCFNFGRKRFKQQRLNGRLNLLSLVMLCFGLTYRHRLSSSFSLPWGYLLGLIPWPIQFCILGVGSCIAWIMLLGLKDYLLLQKYQGMFDKAGIRGGDGIGPLVVSVAKKDDFKTTLVLKSVGIGVDKYQIKKGDIEAALAGMVDSISNGGNPQFIVIELTSRRLTTLVNFEAMKEELRLPQSFAIGETMRGPLVRKIDTLPHMLIAGTTGGGKSVFFKQTLLGLLRTTPHLQLYLLDLKRGIEMKDFTPLPNVRVAKTEEEGAMMLSMVKGEMERRFKYMEEKGYKEIDPLRDKMDKIVVGVDEASVIYGKVKGSSSKAHLVETSRQITDELAKLARAAGIHLILATQKVSKETIDTKVQENIGGRICFRMNTMTNSVTVLGNKMAFELPDIKGRAIWSSGNDFIEVQAPFISEEMLKIEIEEIAEQFASKKRSLYGEMLEFVPTQGKEGSGRKILTDQEGDSVTA